jgi:RNA polymerase sigma-70 factor (ECF subfamily)
MKGDKSISDTIEQWLQAYGDQLHSWAYHKTGDKQAAEDLVQETFLAAFKSLEKFKGNSQPKTWLFSILKNKIIDYHRKKFRENTFNESSLKGNRDKDDIVETFFDSYGRWKPESSPIKWAETDSELLDDLDFKAILQSCMEDLPEKWFSAMQFKYLEQKEGKVICQELDITPSNFWQILHRAKVQLKNCLEHRWFKAQ